MKLIGEGGGHGVQGTVSVYAALLGNVSIAVMKTVGFFMSGSGALFSEAVHSFADSLNQALLLVGLRRSTKEATDGFAYGFGRERFFWARISACGVFFLGAGVTVYHGISSLFSHESVHISGVIFAILAVSFVIEFFTFITAYRELKGHFSDASFFHMVREGDPTTTAVLLEDGVALVGVLIAFVSILLTDLTGLLYWDAFGSIAIGLLLGAAALLLIIKNRRYLIGVSMPERMKRKIVRLIESDPSVEKVIDFKSSTLDINTYRIKCEIEFNGPSLMRELYKQGELREEYDDIRDDYHEFIKFNVEYADRLPRLIGTKIDELEKRIQENFPDVKHIDIEIN